MDTVSEANVAVETKLTGVTPGHLKSTEDRFALKRRENKLKKKKAHRRTLRRSNTKG